MIYENIYEQFGIFQCEFELTIDDRVQTREMQAPRMMIEQEFKRIMKGAMHDTKPVKIRLSVQKKIYDEFTKDWIERDNAITFANNAYVQKYGDL